MPALQLPVGNAQFAVGDVDRDGRMDVYIIDRYPPAGANPRSVYSQSAAGDFALNEALTEVISQTCTTGVDCLYPFFIDIDSDGWLDVIHGDVADGAYGSVAHVRQPGAGFTWAFRADYGVGHDIFNVADIDGDGLSDLVIVNTNILGVGLGQRSQQFEYSPAYLLTIVNEPRPGGVQVIDIDGDGLPDVLGVSINDGVVAMMGRRSPQ